MTISFGAVSAKTDATGASTVAATYPSGVAAGHLALAIRNMMSGVNTVTFLDEAGWSELADFVGGTGNTADAHNSRLRVGSQVLTGSESGTVTFDASANCSCMAMMARYSNGTGQWDVAGANGDDATHGANRAATAATSLALAPGDVVVCVVSVDTDAALTITAPTITASGITFGSVTRRTSGAGSTAGLDGNIEIFDATVTAGTATVAPSFSMTTATSQCGPVAFVRLRETSSGTAYDKTPADSAGVTDTATPVVAADRSQSDPVGVTDTAARVVAADRAPADPVGVTDGASRDVASTRSPADPVGVTDSAVAVLSVVTTKTPDDPVGVTDATDVAASMARTVTDPVGATDSASTTATVERTQADHVDVTDTTSVTTTGQRAPTDPVGVTDTTTTTQTTARTASDPVGVTDSVDASLTGAGERELSDNVGVSDTVVARLDRVVTVADFLALTDAPSPMTGFVRTVGDPVEVIDTPGTVLELLVTVDDPLEVTDTADPSTGAAPITGHRITAGIPLEVRLVSALPEPVRYAASSNLVLITAGLPHPVRHHAGRPT